MAAVPKKISINEVFLSDFLVNKSSKNQNFYIILGPAVAIRVPNMYIKFCKDRSSNFGEKINTALKKDVLRKTRLKFLSMKNRKKIVLTADQRCRHHIESLPLRFFQSFF